MPCNQDRTRELPSGASVSQSRRALLNLYWRHHLSQSLRHHTICAIGVPQPFGAFSVQKVLLKPPGHM
ncbi:MAG TPA: hypothetical protein VK141_10695, partial [Nitrosomonas sp.]|nr:hypothetical protein [Nitrosomonas sp.]